ncbi:uncharacterized protein A1O5_12207 [Cladophialophora psammophila CBS 110553]|uniref:Zn(2)-C6 fungal-type domain-containing protein n=1 Tax=Cladophialophora psammophila CBS 110553 TaxID=1182543 RepID=W9W454_9EURO|nr:uncharacterized protein A1O5_12207 [Cladophialophora psammophila CBS 110553]EXJ59326.1 hypothetical protein A1O5_12207 [Cladophialophora psammophila CBS 110553]
MNSPVRAGQRLAKGATACQRCRRRKQKCDLKYPSCSNCESAHAVCLTYHSGKQAEIPRSYVSDLEAQVEKLTRENQELQQRAQGSPANSENATSLELYSPMGLEPKPFPASSPAASDGSLSRFQDLVRSVRNVVAEASRQPRFLGQSSGITLARLVIAAIRVDRLPSPLFSEQRSYEPSSSAPAAEASLPPRHAADHLVEVYFQHRTAHLPIVERSEVEEALESAYLSVNGRPPSDREVEKDIFTTYMIFAIALFDVPNPSGGRPIQSEGCFRSAISWIEKVITYSKSDLDTLRSILLLAQFVALHPSRGSLWHLTGIALRLCIDMGLHWETEEQSLNMAPTLLYQRRRLWYSTYQFDRVLCITLGRPFGIIDESISVPLPDPSTVSLSRQGTTGSEPKDFDVHSQHAHNHLFSMSKLESEIKHVQHTQAWSPKVAYPRVDYAAWLQDMRPRLQEWYTNVPPPSKAHPSSIFAYQAFWDAIYNNAILLLYRPNTTVLYTSTEGLVVSFDASCKLITSIKILQREGKIDVLWKWVHHLFMAGLGAIYGLWLSKEIRDRNPVSKCISTLQSCASTLAALSESFPGAAGCRDVFETLSAATIDRLVAVDPEGNKRENHSEFEKQVEDLLQQLQPSSRGGGVGTGMGMGGMSATANETSLNTMSGMLSTDAFSEMLSSAAQWPDCQDMDFSDVGFGCNELWYEQARWG